MIAIGDPSSLNTVAQRLIAIYRETHGSESVKESLIEIGPPAVEPLIAALEDSFYSQSYADILVNIGKPAIKPLIASLDDKKGSVHKAAARALSQLGWQPEDKSTVAASYWAANQQWTKCIEIGPLAVEPLMLAFDTESWGEKPRNVKRDIAETLRKDGRRSPTDHCDEQGERPS